MTPTVTSSMVDRCLAAAPRVRALVVGDVMLDRYLSGEVERVSPEAPVPIVKAERRRSALGGAANVAAGVHAIGAECDVVGVVGGDRAGRRLGRLLGEHGIDGGGLVVDRSRPTTVKTRVLARRQQVLRIDRETTTPIEPSTVERLLQVARERLARADVLVIQNYDKGAVPPELARPLLREAQASGVRSVVDPKLRHFFDFGDADVFKPNARELAAALGREAPPDRAELSIVATRIGCRTLLVTLGDRGMWLLEEGETEAVHIPSHAVEVYDVSGAGDTVTAVLSVGLATGTPMAEAAGLANFAAGLAVGHLGARPVPGSELAAAVHALERELSSGG